VRRDLPRSTAADLTLVDEFVDRNELGAAFDALVGVGSATTVGPNFWQHLMAAAIEMMITPEDDTHGASVKVVMQNF
jgi:undecaprenyl pyrophosphate phosphatase UppP